MNQITLTNDSGVSYIAHLQRGRHAPIVLFFDAGGRHLSTHFVEDFTSQRGYLLECGMAIDRMRLTPANVADIFKHLIDP